MKLSDRLAEQEAQEKAAAEAEVCLGDDAFVWDEEDFWEATELLQECLFHMDQVVKYCRIHPGRRRALTKTVGDVGQFLSEFIEADPAETLTVINLTDDDYDIEAEVKEEQ